MSYTLTHDTDTHDLVIDQGKISTISGDAEIGQAVRLLLSTFRGEYENRTNMGVDHWAYLGQPYHPERTPALIQAVIRDALRQEPRITEVTGITSQFDSSERTLYIQVRCKAGQTDITTDVEIGI